MVKQVLYLIVFSFLIILIGCNSSNTPVTQNIPIESDSKISESVEAKPIESNKPDDISEITEDEWSYYFNARYGFSIKYPSEWTAGEESDNGDGKSLYIGNPDIQILAYASNYMEDTSDPYHEDENVQLQRTRLENGYESVLIVGKEEGKVLFDMVYISTQDIEYHFYASVSEKFFEDNEQILLKVAKSLDSPE
ncbi:hypothetical protein BK125_17185 [Paenibacillus odorifer]|uniref:PsbP C-terminal domain-containing protein n=1 Tax=Paenibacillus odorifer TaxID=189426 RepID=A0ABX3GMA7_9BACL|nr:hypothetical protein [Paenibacillus odorifer]OMC76787.1 hypothetical protein BK125_17185 [Paenibacillus odorifer]OMD33150.1 hypothetical protein BSO21_15725 [Paenibacillus odorifer]